MLLILYRYYPAPNKVKHWSLETCLLKTRQGGCFMATPERRNNDQEDRILGKPEPEE